MVARAWSGLWCGTREPVAPMGRPASGTVWACGRSSGARTRSSRSARGRVVMRGTVADLTVVVMTALYWGLSEGEGSSWLALRPTACGWEESGERAEAEVGSGGQVGGLEGLSAGKGE